MRIVFFVANYMPHQMASINALLNNYDVEIHAFSISKSYKYHPESTKKLYVYPSVDLKKELFDRVLKIKPQLLVVAGWLNLDFVRTARKIRSICNVPVVTYSDTQWQNTLKQRINCLISPFYLRRAFTHIWVAGFYQYEYARRLGFAKEQILFNALSCNVEFFKNISLKHKKEKYPKNILYVGRFVSEKGLELLIAAWNAIKDKNGWSLTLVGDGSLKDNFRNIENVTIKDFMTQNQLVKEFENAGCFILPSVFEPWALVLHEAAAAGLPIIATTVCGATPHFLINKYNGFTINPTEDAMKDGLQKIMSLDDDSLYSFSQNSRCLADSITPEKGAAQLLSIIK